MINEKISSLSINQSVQTTYITMTSG